MFVVLPAFVAIVFLHVSRVNTRFSLHLAANVSIFTGNVRLRGDSVKQQQAGRPRQSAATLQPRNDGTEH